MVEIILICQFIRNLLKTKLLLPIFFLGNTRASFIDAFICSFKGADQEVSNLIELIDIDEFQFIFQKKFCQSNRLAVFFHKTFCQNTQKYSRGNTPI